MISELFRVGPLVITPYGLLLATSFLVAGVLLSRNARRYNVASQEDVLSITTAAALGGMLGGKIYYTVLYGDVRLLWNLGGLVWYGGFLGGTLLVLFTLVRRRLPIARSLDVIAPSLALGYAVGRVGCFLVGDDYGYPTDLPWGVAFPVGLPPTTAGNLSSVYGIHISDAIAATELLKVHPTQLYETALAAGIALIGVHSLKRASPPGLTAAYVTLLLGFERFLVEFLRAKDDRFFGNLTLAQSISVALIGAASLAWYLLRRHAGVSITPARPS